MKFLRSDSPEMARSISSSAALACWGWIVGPLMYASVVALFLAVAVGFISVRAAVWIGVPVFVGLNSYMLWRARSPRLNWGVAGSADQIFVRLFLWRVKKRDDLREPDVLALEAPDIASIRVRTVEVFLDGSKPKLVEWLVIEPSAAVSESFTNHLRSILNSTGVRETGKQAIVTMENGCLTMEWKHCSPSLPEFLQRVARGCPSVVIGAAERSELDLNGIWRGISRNLRESVNPEGRQKLVRAKRLGFGCDCAALLGRYRRLSFREAGAYLADIEREEAEQAASSRT